MNMKRLFSLILSLVMALSLTPAALAIPSTAGCPSRDALLRNNGNHYWNEGDRTQPWCENAGYIYYQCVYCNQYVEEQWAPPLGHDWGPVTVIKPATCTEYGQTSCTCRRCGKEDYKQIPPLGHDWGNWSTMSTGDCYTPGSEARYCRRCSAMETRPTASQHVFGPWVEVSPGTCVNQAKLERTCRRCGYVEFALGDFGPHNWGEWYVVKQPTPHENGMERRVCWNSADHTEYRDLYYIGDPGVPTNDYEPSIDIIWTSTSDTSACAAGDWVTFYFTVENNGNMNWSFSGLASSGDNDHLFDGSFIAPLVGTAVAPGGSLNTALRIQILEQDMQNGQISISNVWAKAKLDNGDDIDSTAVHPYASLPGAPSPEATPMPNPDPNPDPDENEPVLHLEVTCTSVEPFYFGTDNKTPDINYVLTISNLGKAPCEVYEVQINTAGGFFLFSLSTPVWLYPGDSIDEPYVHSFAYEEMDEQNKLHISFLAVASTVDHVYTSNSIVLTHDTAVIPPFVPDEYTTSVSVIKGDANADSHPGPYHVNDTITYIISVTNTSDTAIPALEVWDPLYSDTEPVATIYNLEPAETERVWFSYTVPAEALDSGLIYNIAKAQWLEDGWLDREAYSNPCQLYITDGQDKGEVAIFISFEKIPDNGSYYIVGESCPITVTWQNVSLIPLYNVHVYDFQTERNGYNSGDIVIGGTLAPGELGSHTLNYTVDEYDLLWEHVYDNAYIKALDDQGNEYYEYTYNVAPVSEDPVPEKKTASLNVFKEEVSHPLNGSYYTENEVIEYKIHLYNDGEQDLTDVMLFDSLSSSFPYSDFATTTIFHVGQEAVYSFKYLVTAEDVESGWVINSATALYACWEAVDVPVKSNEVKSRTSDKDPVPKPDPTPSGQDSCVLTLTGRSGQLSEYTLEPCAAHKAVIDRVSAMTNSTFFPKSAWEQAGVVWRKALDDMYQVMMDAARGEARSFIMNDRAAFYAYLSSWQTMQFALRPNDGAQIAQEAAMMLMRQCCDLCYLHNHAPEARPDSIITGQYNSLPDSDVSDRCAALLSQDDQGNFLLREILCPEHAKNEEVLNNSLKAANNRDSYASAFLNTQRQWTVSMNNDIGALYKAADPDAKKLIGSCRSLFDGMLAARQDLLAYYYPGNPEIAAEVLYRTIKDQALLLCQYK